MDEQTIREFVAAFEARIAFGLETEQCACQVFPEVSNAPVHRELVETMMAEVINAFSNDGPEAAVSMLGHALTVAIAFGLGFGATDVLADNSDDYSWGLSDEQIEALSREDFLGD